MLSNKEFEAFRKETEQALQEIAKKYGVDIKAGKIKYDNNSFNLDLKVTKKDIDGKTYEKVEFEKYCFLYGLRPGDYKKQFNMNGETFYIIGFKPRASKMPIIAINNKGQRYKFGEETVKRLIAS